MDVNFVKICAVLGAGIAAGFGAIGSAVGEGLVAKQAVDALGRQPHASGKIVRLMVIAQAVTETAAIFALVIALVLLFRDTSSAEALKGYTYLAAGIAIGLGTIGSGLGSGLPGSTAMEGLGRNPENSDGITVNMIIGQAVTQTSCIFALTISLLLIMSDAPTTITKVTALLGAGFAMGFGAIGPGIGDGLVALNANRAVGRDPRNMGLLTRTMIIGQAITETTDIYAMVVALILIFVA